MQCDSSSLLYPPDTIDSTRYKSLAQAGLIRMFGPGSWKQRGPLCWFVPALSYLCYDLITWTSLVAQLVKNLPAMQEILVQFLGREDLLEKG